jgi:hypothetical protein
MTPLADIVVRSVEGSKVRLGDIVDRPTIVVIPRYYGCLPCRDYLRQVSERYQEVEAAGGQAVGVSGGAEHQARWLMEERGIRFPLLLDPDRQLYEAIALPRRWWVSLNPRGWWNYARAIARGSRQGKIIEPNQLPGLALLDANADAVWVHRGNALGDYPPLADVLARLERLVQA